MSVGTVGRTAVAVLVAVLLVGTACASVWLMASSGVLSFAGDEGLPASPGPGASAPPGAGSVLAAGDWQVSQPRDPFQPLITSPSTVPVDSSSTSGGGTTTTGGGTTTTGGGTTTTGGGTTTTGGSTTSTTSQTPTTRRVSLLEVREVGGVREAVLTVDGVTYTVRVGDTFADDFKVISLAENSGVFMYKDLVFTLAEGQSIVK